MAKLPKFEDWKAPWETEGDEIDPDKAKKLVYDLKAEVEKLKESKATITAEKNEIIAERDTAIAERDALKRKDESETDRLKREKAELETKLAAKNGKSDDDTPDFALALDVALDIDGITPKQAKVLAKSLRGKDRDALEAHAEELVEQFGVGKSKDDDPDGDAGAGKADDPPRRSPRSVNNPADPDRGKADPLADMDKVLELIPRA